MESIRTFFKELRRGEWNDEEDTDPATPVFWESCDQTLVKLNDVENDAPPLFIIPHINATVDSLIPLAMKCPFPVYGLMFTKESRSVTWEDITSVDIENMDSVCFTGPYRILGAYTGCLRALSIACKLQQLYPDRKDVVHSLVLLNGSPAKQRETTKIVTELFNYKTSREHIGGSLITMLVLFTSVKVETITELHSQLKTCEFSKQLSIVVEFLVKNQLATCRSRALQLVLVLLELQTTFDSYELPTVPYAGDMTLVKSKDNVQGSLGNDFNLHEVCDGNVKVVEVDSLRSALPTEDEAAIEAILSALL